MDTAQKMLNIRLCGASHIGNVRSQNQDRYFYGKVAPLWQVTTNLQSCESASVECSSFHGQVLVAAIADGMGGHADGSIAAEIAIQTFLSELADTMRAAVTEWTSEEWKASLSQAVIACQRKLLQYQNENPQSRGMGTTFTAATIIDSCIYITHIGDSRCYLLDESGLRRLTLDHNLAQLMVDEGVMTVDQVAHTDYGHRLYNALGNSRERAIPDLLVIPWHKEAKLLLCSDGLSNDVSDEEIERILLSDYTTDEMCQVLIDKALLHAGKDNITVVLAGLE